MIVGGPVTTGPPTHVNGEPPMRTDNLPERGSDALLAVLDLERVETDLYRANFVFDDPFALYGGQVAAQALRAAGLTVPEGRLPHSLHSYFLRPGDASVPTVFQVYRDRDGGSYSARRVVALQEGKVIFNLSASFHVGGEGPDLQPSKAPAVHGPEACRPYALPRLFGLESRACDEEHGSAMWPMRFWSRTDAPLPADDQLLHACVLTYLSDISSGVIALEEPGAREADGTPVPGHAVSGSSLDHAVWFHRPVRMDDWVLMDHEGQTAASGRGWYTGSIHDTDGRLVASLAQECLFRPARAR